MLLASVTEYALYIVFGPPILSLFSDRKSILKSNSIFGNISFQKEFRKYLYIIILQLPPLSYHPSIPHFPYLVRSSKLGRSWAHAVSELSKCRNPHHRHPPSGFGGCIPENGVSPAQPVGPETTCHVQQKWYQNGSTRPPLSSCLLQRTWQSRVTILVP